MATKAAVRSTARRLRLSNGLKDRLVAACVGRVRIDADMSGPDMRRALWLLGARAFRDQALLAWAGSDDGGAHRRWLCLLDDADRWPRPDFPISGDDILAAGVPQGPRVGQIHRAMESWWLDQDFTPDRQAVMGQLTHLARSLSDGTAQSPASGPSGQ